LWSAKIQIRGVCDAIDSAQALGAGEHLLAGIDLRALGFERVEYVGTPKAAHYMLVV